MPGAVDDGPYDRVLPNAVRVLGEQYGIDIAAQRPRHIDTMLRKATTLSMVVSMKTSRNMPKMTAMTADRPGCDAVGSPRGRFALPQMVVPRRRGAAVIWAASAVVSDLALVACGAGTQQRRPRQQAQPKLKLIRRRPKLR